MSSVNTDSETEILNVTIPYVSINSPSNTTKPHNDNTHEEESYDISSDKEVEKEIAINLSGKNS